MNNKAELLEKYSSNLTGSKNRNHYLAYAKDFLGYADNLNKETVTKYIEHLRRKKMSPGTVNFAFRVVRRLFMVNAAELKDLGIVWPFLRGEAPMISQRDEDKPALDIDFIKIMIDAAKEKKLPADEAAFLSLSTVYGLRRGEIVNLQPQDISFSDNTIYIATLKGGRERYHLIPPEIGPYLREHDFEIRYSLTSMSQMFWRVINHCEIEELKQYRLGWHSIRRLLLTLLHKAGLDVFGIHQFLRWKGGAEGSLAMDARYHATSFIGLKGKHVVAMEAEGDREIFEKHPLLELWR